MASDPKPKVWKGWCIYDSRGDCWWDCVRGRRRDAIRAAVEFFVRSGASHDRNWPALRKRGFTVRRVSLSPLEGERNG